MLHAARQRRPWLIFDVGQKMKLLAKIQDRMSRKTLKRDVRFDREGCSPSDLTLRSWIPNVKLGKIGAAKVSKHTGKEGVGD